MAESLSFDPLAPVHSGCDGGGVYVRSPQALHARGQERERGHSPHQGRWCPHRQAIPGFVAYGILDAGHGHIVTYSAYDGQAGTQESTKKAAAWVKENIASLLPTPPHVVEGAIKLREIKEAAKYGVVRRYQVDPKNIDKIVANVKSGFLPIVTRLPGYASYAMLDAGKGTLVTISGFSSSSGAAESTKAAATYIKEHLAPLVP